MLKRLALLEPAPPWSLYAGIGAVVAMFLAIIVGATLATTLLAATPAQPLAGWVIGGTITIAFVAITRRRTPAESAALRLNAPSALPLPIVLLLALGLAITLDLLGLAFTGDFWPVAQLMGFFLIGAGDTLVARADVGLGAWALAALLLVIVLPLAEELVLRGVLYPALRTTLGAWPGLLMNAAFQMAFYLFTYVTFQLDGVTPLWFGVIFPFLVGLLLACIRAYTGSTRAAIVAHVGFGLFAVLKALALMG